jgi:hypothetical protein
MFQRNTLVKALAGSLMLASLALTGCGSAAAPTVPDDTYGADAGYADPGTGMTPATGALPGTTGTLPATGNLGMGATSAQLTANLTVLKKGFLLGKTKVKVDVSNPSTQQLSGTLTVTFTKKGKPTSTVKTQAVSLAGGASQSFEFDGKMIGTDGATCDITTDAPAMSANQPAMGATAGLGSTLPGTTI